MSTQNLSVWEKNGSLAEMFWKNGKGDFPVYDMHGHMGTSYAIYQPYCEAEKIISHMQEAGVRRLVFSHAHVLVGEMRNQQCIDICHHKLIVMQQPLR